ncbi:MAG: hypothetical protein OEY30_02455, partial [Candidatus Bathyarchaeota archaeon]|nr:hypothetical protein [Candidatus Bathyarchaeota archaeon]
AVIIKRKYFEGLKCHKCGAFTDRPWSNRVLQKCRECGAKTYYGKPVLVKSLRMEERLTKKGRKLLEVAEQSAWKIKMPTIEQLGFKVNDLVFGDDAKEEVMKELTRRREAGDATAYHIFQAYVPDLRRTYWMLIEDKTLPRVELPGPRRRGRPRVHLAKSEYKGSQRASDAAKKAWATRRKGAVVVGFYTDQEGEARPITKSTDELNREKVIRKPREFRGVKPKQKKTVNKHGIKKGDFIKSLRGNP